MSEEEREHVEELPEDPQESAGEEGGVDDEGRSPPAEDLQEDPAYNPESDAAKYKGG